MKTNRIRTTITTKTGIPIADKAPLRKRSSLRVCSVEKEALMKLSKIVKFAAMSKGAKTGAKAMRNKPVRKATASFIKSYALWKFIRKK